MVTLRYNGVTSQELEDIMNCRFGDHNGMGSSQFFHIIMREACKGNPLETITQQPYGPLVSHPQRHEKYTRDSRARLSVGMLARAFQFAVFLLSLFALRSKVCPEIICPSCNRLAQVWYTVRQPGRSKLSLRLRSVSCLTHSLAVAAGAFRVTISVFVRSCQG